VKVYSGPFYVVQVADSSSAEGWRDDAMFRDRDEADRHAAGIEQAPTLDESDISAGRVILARVITLAELEEEFGADRRREVTRRFNDVMSEVANSEGRSVTSLDDLPSDAEVS
jgi:hypothetical protein